MASRKPLFAVGANLYREVDDPEVVDMQIPQSAFEADADAGNEAEPSTDYESDDLEPDIDLDATVTADYESID
jgi:hypothetical protein